VLDDSQIIAKTSGSGHAGAITIDANSISINGGELTLQSDGSGLAGDINLQLNGGDLNLENAFVKTSALFSDGGNITIDNIGRLRLDGGAITTEVGSGFGDGGNIRISGKHILLDRSTLTANAFGGRGGNISLKTGTVLKSPSSRITASSTLGIDGVIQTDAPIVDVSENNFGRNLNARDAQRIGTSLCDVQSQERLSSLVRRAETLQGGASEAGCER
jgi:hypothetical protein